MVDFKKLKSMSGSAGREKLTKALEQANSKGNFQQDDRFWYPDVDKAGNGYAVIRFLPAVAEGEDMPFVRVFEHGFKGPNGTWYVEKSLTTIGKADPVSEYNSQLWNSGLEDNKKKAQNQKRKLNFVSNIYIANDHAHPENNGKVKLYKYGKKIFDKLNDAMNPPDIPGDDQVPMNPFDLWEGADLKLRIRNVEGYRNYDKSEFSTPSPLFDNDEKIEIVWKQGYALNEFIDPSKFKTYEELKEKMNKVLELNSTPKSIVPEEAPKPSRTRAPTPERELETASIENSDDGDEDLDYFQKLAE